MSLYLQITVVALYYVYYMKYEASYNLIQQVKVDLESSKYVDVLILPCKLQG